MKSRQVQSKKRYLLSFIIGTTIFILIFAFTYSIAYLEYQQVSSLQVPLSYKIFEDKIQYSLFDKSICSVEAYKEISEDLALQGRVIGDVEEKLGKTNEDVLFRKKFYSLILLEHFEITTMMKKECGANIDTILFFYSNEEEDLEGSEDVGRLLGTLHRRENLFIYSFDMNLDSELIKSLVEKYEVSAPMKIIVNENQTFNSIENINQIKEHLTPENSKLTLNAAKLY